MSSKGLPSFFLLRLSIEGFLVIVIKNSRVFSYDTRHSSFDFDPRGFGWDLIDRELHDQEGSLKSDIDFSPAGCLGRGSCKNSGRTGIETAGSVSSVPETSGL